MATPHASPRVVVALESLSTLLPVTRCDLCGDSSFRPRGAVRDLLLGMPGVYEFQQCTSCSLSFVSPRPRPEQIGAFYPESYAEHQDTRAQDLARWERLQGDPAAKLSLGQRFQIFLGENRSYQILPPPRHAAAILDIGCASGTFLDKMRLLGWRTFGLEPDARAADLARRSGHQVSVGSMEEGLPFADQQFDTVYCWHALEHSHSPATALAEIRRVLKPGGHFVMAVPNFGSLQARMFGRFWSKLEPPRHLFHFTRRTLRRYLANAGFKHVQIRTRTGATSWWRNLRCAINGLFGTSLRRDPAWVIALLEVPVFLGGLVGYLGVGSDLRVVCQADVTNPTGSPSS